MNNAQIKAYYEARYQHAQCHAFPNDINRTTIFIHPILQRIAPGGKILDIGCGVGYACELLDQHQFEVYGIDISEEAVTLAQKRVPQGQFSPIDNDRVLPYPNSFFNAITCLGVLEHALHPGVLLKECRRIIKTSGMAVFVVPNVLSPHFFFLSGTGQIYEKPRTRAEWSHLLLANGFTIVETRKDPGPTLVKSYPVKKKAKLFMHRLLNLLPLNYTYQFIFVVVPI
jgi:2-polyprenyl-3-methyl-5-hydroxy-6-metoxy-1,4-benzoquinol methylase